LSLGGTVIGAVLNAIFPAWLVLLLLVIVLVFTTYRTTAKAIEIYKHEQQIKSVKSPKQIFVNSNVELPEIESPSYPTQSSSNSLLTDSPSQQPLSKESTSPNSELDKILLAESKIPWKIVLLLFFILAVVTVSSLLKGNSSKPSFVGVTVCSAWYWVILVGLFVFLVAITVAYVAHLIKMNSKKEKLNYPFQQGDIHWTKKSASLTAVVAVIAGILASLLGIGGGMVLSPLMLELRILPDVTASTSTFMILFTSVSSMVQFLIQGTFMVDYGVLLLILGLLSSFAGQTAINLLVKRFNRKSSIVFSISIIVALSTCLLVASGIESVVANVKAGVSFGFLPYC